MNETKLIGFVNELHVQSDGWAQLAPFGDFPGEAIIANASGRLDRQAAIQRIDKPAADGMVRKFKSPVGRLRRWFTGCPIFKGHPDVPTFAHQHRDTTPKGMITDLEVRSDGLYCLPVFTNEGMDLIDRRQVRAFSAHWSAVPGGDESGKPIFRPDQLISAGLTDRPNLPVQMLNEQKTMNREKILAWLSKHGIKLANEATDEQIEAALGQVDEKITTLSNEKTTVATSLANAKQEVTTKVSTINTLTTERDQAKTDFANERAARIGMLLDGALADGRITAAQKPDWQTKLQANFANETTALANIKPAVKTNGVTENLGQRKGEADTAATAHQKVISLANERMRKNDESWEQAWAGVKLDAPELFRIMQTKAE